MNTTTPPRPKKILVVSAHPEPRSLNASLAAFAVDELRAAGHEVRVSDLYAMKWKATVDADDFSGHAGDQRLHVMAASERDTFADRLSSDIAAEQEKVRWSDAVILQFPMWWFSAPAILKGWIDRVFTSGFGYGPAVPPPYSEGVLAGRRALVSVTLGARESSFSDRGIHGLPRTSCIRCSTGCPGSPAWHRWNRSRCTTRTSCPMSGSLRRSRSSGSRLDGLFTDEPVPFRSLVGGDYDHDMRLLPGVETPGTSGLDLHVRPRG